MIHWLRTFAIFAASAPALAQGAPTIGDITDIVIRYETESETFQATSGLPPSTSSSGGSYHYVDTVIAVSEAGIEREISLPEAGEEVPLVVWEFPVRVLERPDGSLELRNREELIARRDHFMAEAEIPMEACGTYYFTWNMFQINCDPESILSTLATFNLQPEGLSEGATYEHDGAAGPGVIGVVSESSSGLTYQATMPIDANGVLREKAETAVIIAPFFQTETTLEAELAKRSDHIVTGTVTITWEADPEGRVHTRRENVEFTYDDLAGEVERGTSQRTFTRRLR